MREAVIYKYPLEWVPVQEIVVPGSASILNFQVQNGTLVMWCISQKGDISTTTGKFHIIGTGNLFQFDGLSYMGTVQSGDYVWHIFQEVDSA